MKRELKGIGRVDRCEVINVIARLIPMKRELKVHKDPCRQALSGNRKAHPDEKGTESRETRDGQCRLVL